MKIYSWEEIVESARKHSPYYHDLYQNLPQTDLKLTDIPVLDVTSFWKEAMYPENRVLTRPQKDGVIFRTGGTTGKPKYVPYSEEEWRTSYEVTGRGFMQAGLKNGDRVLNLFFAGGLAGGFQYAGHSIEAAPIDLVHVPIMGTTDVAQCIQVIEDFSVNVLLGLPPTIVHIADAAEKRQGIGSQIERIIFGGQMFNTKQRELVKKVFPNVRISSTYASNDAGALGYGDPSCGPDEFREYSDIVLLELIDPISGQPITETGRGGTLIATSLTRILMPIIRYPVGDRAMFLEPPDRPYRKFKLTGRTHVREYKIGPQLFINPNDIALALSPFLEPLQIIQHQIVLDRTDGFDGMVIALVSEAPEAKRSGAEDRIVRAIYEKVPKLEEQIEMQFLKPLTIEWRDVGELATDPSSGKLLSVVEKTD